MKLVRGTIVAYDGANPLLHNAFGVIVKIQCRFTQVYWFAINDIRTHKLCYLKALP